MVFLQITPRSAIGKLRQGLKAPLNFYRIMLYICAMKRRIRGGSIIQVKEKGRGQRKITFHGSTTMEQVKHRLNDEFSINQQTTNTKVLNGTDEEVTSTNICDYYI